MRPAHARVWSHGAVRFGASVLALLLAIAVAAPWLGTVDPAAMDAASVNAPAGAQATYAIDGEPVVRTLRLGGDAYGRDLYSRLVHGTRVSLVVAIATATVAMLVGASIGLLAGCVRQVDPVAMRAMDAVMAVPPVLLAIVLVALLGASLPTIVAAIAAAEAPRVARLTRSVVLALREEPFIEAARVQATGTIRIVALHVLPNALGPLVVQATYIAAAAVLTEAVLGFLGLGLPPDVPSWGVMIAEAREQFAQHPHHMLYPTLMLVPTILAINMLGDGLRETLDPRFMER